MNVHSNRTGRSRAAESAKGFERYDQCRFAILLNFPHGRRPLMGTAHYERDDLLGGILRFSLEADCPGRPEIIIAENEWNGSIISGRPYHCEYCLRLMMNGSESLRSPGGLP